MRQLWQKTFAEDSIALKHLPKKIVLKARSILSSIEKGTRFWQLSGKRFVADRSFVSIPVNYHYRLVGRLCGECFHPHEVLSHESYNRIARHGRMRVAGDPPEA